MDPLLIALIIGVVVFACVYAFTAGQGQKVGLFGLIACTAVFLVVVLIRALSGAAILG